MMQRLGIAVMLIVLTLLAACVQQTTITAQPLNVSTPVPADSCAGVQCGANAYCEAGKCLCDGGFKKCGTSCIGSAACCEDTDCPNDRTCAKGACVMRPVCGYHEVWDNDLKECTCDSVSKFCKEQIKCIPAKSCCAETTTSSGGEAGDSVLSSGSSGSVGGIAGSFLEIKYQLRCNRQVQRPGHLPFVAKQALTR